MEHQSGLTGPVWDSKVFWFINYKGKLFIFSVFYEVAAGGGD